MNRKTHTTKAVLLVLLIAFLLLTFSTGCNLFGDKVEETKEGWNKFQGLTNCVITKECLGLGGSNSDTCPGN